MAACFFAVNKKVLHIIPDLCRILTFYFIKKAASKTEAAFRIIK